MFNFSEVESVDRSQVQTQTSKWVNKPGYYLGKLRDVTHGASSKGTPYLSLVFDTSGGEFTEKVYITQNNLKRVKFIYEEMSGNPLNQQIASVSALADFFKMALVRLEKTYGLVIRGELVGDKFYAQGDYYFVNSNIDNFKERVIEIGSEEFKTMVSAGRITVREANIPQNDNPIVNSKPSESNNSKPITESGFLPVADDDSELPF